MLDPGSTKPGIKKKEELGGVWGGGVSLDIIGQGCTSQHQQRCGGSNGHNVSVDPVNLHPMELWALQSLVLSNW